MCPCRIYYFWQAGRHWVCAHAKFIAFRRTEGIGCVPMQNLFLLPSWKALDVCPCRIYCFWQAGRHWVCAHAEFIAFGRTGGIGCVPMQNLLLLAGWKALGVCPCRTYSFWQAGRHWVCAHADLIPFDRSECIGSPVCTGTCLGAWLCGQACSCPCRVAWTMIVRGRGGGRGASHRVLHLLRYCATLARPGPQATASCGRWHLALTA